MRVGVLDVQFTTTFFKYHGDVVEDAFLNFIKTVLFDEYALKSKLILVVADEVVFECV